MTLVVSSNGCREGSARRGQSHRSSFHRITALLPWLGRVRRAWGASRAESSLTLSGEVASSTVPVAGHERTSEVDDVPCILIFDPDAALLVDGIVKPFDLDGLLSKIRQLL